MDLVYIFCTASYVPLEQELTAITSPSVPIAIIEELSPSTLRSNPNFSPTISFWVLSAAYCPLLALTLDQGHLL